MKIIEIDDKARLKLHSGINKAGNILRSTYGPSGLNILLGSKFFKPAISNDGLRAIKSIEFEDEVENLAVRVVEAGMQTTNDLAGDNRTATGILIQEIYNEGYKNFDMAESLIKKSTNPQKIRKEIEEECKKVVQYIKEKAEVIESLEDLKKVALIATEDDDLAEIISKVVFEVGGKGIIKVEESDELGITPSISQGMEVSLGYVSDFMVTNERKESVVENANILVFKNKLDNYSRLLRVAFFLEEQGCKDLVIFAPDFDANILNVFKSDRLKEIFRILAIKIPVWDNGLFQDICTVSGARLIQNEKVEIGDLGKVGKVISSKDKTILIDGKKDVSDAVSLLEEEIKITKSPFEKQKLEDRIGRISGKVALIEVGGLSEVDRGRTFDKVKDGVHATQGALQEGVLPGGGQALYDISREADIKILTEPLKACYEQIQKNSGTLNIGEDVLDSAKSVRIAFESASRIASNLLTVGTISVDKHEIDTE